jgi:hypothetical protein
MRTAGKAGSLAEDERRTGRGELLPPEPLHMQNLCPVSRVPRERMERLTKREEGFTITMQHASGRPPLQSYGLIKSLLLNPKFHIVLNTQYCTTKE